MCGEKNESVATVTTARGRIESVFVQSCRHVGQRLSSILRPYGDMHSRTSHPSFALMGVGYTYPLKLPFLWSDMTHFNTKFFGPTRVYLLKTATRPNRMCSELAVV